MLPLLLSSRSFIALVLCCTYYCYNALAYTNGRFSGGYGQGGNFQKPQVETNQIKEVQNYPAAQLPSGYGGLPPVNFGLQSSGQQIQTLQYQSINTLANRGNPGYANIPGIQPSSYAPSSTVQPPPVHSANMLSGYGQPAVNYGLSSVMPPVAVNYGYVQPSTIDPATMATQQPLATDGYAAVPSSAALSGGQTGQISGVDSSQQAPLGYGAQPGSSAVGGGQSQTASDGASPDSGFGYAGSPGAQTQGMAASGGSQQTEAMIGYAAPPGTPATPMEGQGIQGGESQAASGGSQTPQPMGYGGQLPSMPGVQQQQQQTLDPIDDRTEEQTATMPPPPGYAQPPQIPANGGYLTLAALSKGTQGKPSYASNVGGQGVAVVNTPPPTVAAPTPGSAPCTATPPPPPGYGAMPVSGYGAGAPPASAAGQEATATEQPGSGCTANVPVKKLDQPMPTEAPMPPPTTSTTAKPTTTTTTAPTTTTTRATTRAKRPCADNHRFCSFWMDQGECEKNPDYMKVNCAMSCKSCF